ncbi:cobalt ECF transporter T component CbiQ [Planotetraspora thailandica]|uniref:Cobalt ECF transporter T component CbiQ n=1 Tax=Planotetraspora thailandica TaxID=487172 RepID=A0A8J4DE18_9ACTN|nr:cobalt ECF transporter T component CbiQ [Planotetraspora thailandica]GII58127.1 cobalt ECF transporter T component CbiQ [Planotetraspora thailandica]
MSAGHHHTLYLPGDTPIHRLPPQCKLLAAVGFAVAVVATPREAWWAFAVDVLLLAGVAAVARVPAALVLRRMVIEVPFVLFAVAIPFIGLGERVEVAGVSLSVAGLWAAWNILVKATLGVVASILLAATTEPRMMLLGAERLRLPSLLVQIATFMLRYMDVIIDQARRMRIARESRGFVARDIRHAPTLARSAGALFIRSYERGERVHLAMLSRGYTGQMPVIHELPAPRRDWAVAAALPGLALATAALAWSLA